MVRIAGRRPAIRTIHTPLINIWVSQRYRAGEIFKTWYANDPKKTFEAVVAKISAAFLVEGYPPELATKMAEWKNQTKLGLGAKDTKKFADFEAWRDGWTKGLEQYHALWKDWKGP